MNVSVIIPNLNSPILGQVLRKIITQAQNEHVGEILIVGKDNLQRHQTVPDERIRLIDTGHPVNAAKARNIGIQHARYELLLFLDSDCLPQPGWLQNHLAAQAKGHTVVGGGVAPTGSNYWSRSYNLTLFHEFFSINPAGEKNYLPTLNLSIHKQVIDAIGLLDEVLSRGQDIEWTTRMKRAGYVPYFEPEAIVVHEHSRNNFTAVWQDCARSGYHMRRVRLKYPNLFTGSILLQNQVLLLLLSPLVASTITFRIVVKHLPLFLKQWQTIPAIFLTKVAWCWGAVSFNPASNEM